LLTTLETVVINQYLNYSLEYLVTAIVNRKIYVTILHYAVILTMTTGWAKKNCTSSLWPSNLNRHRVTNSAT